MKNLFQILRVGWWMGIFSSLLAQQGFSQNENFYEKSWKEIENALSKGLPKTALEIVDKIYAQSKTDKNSGQQVKALLHRLIYIREVEENTLVSSINYFKSEAETAQYPVKPLLHSILADIYWQYYQGNSWRFEERTASNMKNEDIETWDLRKIVEQSLAEYQKSLEKPELLKEVKIDIYDEVMQKGNAKMRNYRATLYDFLAFRAFNFFSSATADITQPAKTFLIDNPDYLADSERFVNLELKTSDNLSYKFYALKILQDLTKFNLSKNNLGAKGDIDLVRLNYVYNNAVFQNKKKLYLEALEKHAQKYKEHEISLEFAVKVAEIWVAEGNTFHHIKNPSTKNQKKEAYQLTDSILQKFPKSEGWNRAKQLQEQIKSKSIALQVENVVPNNSVFPVYIKYQNVNTLYWRIIATSPEKFAKMGFNQHNYRENEYMAKAIRNEQVFKKWQTQLPDEKDFNVHALEEKIAGLPSGYYIIAVSTKENFEYEKNAIAYQNIQVSNIAYLTQNLKNGETQLLTFHRTTGTPLSDIKIECWKNYYDYGKSKYINELAYTLITDKNGLAIMPPRKNNQEYATISYKFFGKDDKLLETTAQYQSGYYEREPTATVFAHIFTDRNIYRPSQEVFFKALILTTNAEQKTSILPNETVKVILKDVNGQLVTEQNFTSNEFGSINGKFTLPSIGLTGNMTLIVYKGGQKIEHILAEKQTAYEVARDYNVTIQALKEWNKDKNLDALKAGDKLIIYNMEDNYNSYLALQNIRVEEYKRPKFEVTFEPLKGTYKVDDEISVKGAAKAYSGANIDGAILKFRVKRTAQFPSWFYYWRGYYPSSPEQIITFGEAKTNEKGEFIVKFKAIPDVEVEKESNPTFSYQIEADVTDQNGETRSGNTSVRIGYQALELNVNIPAQVDLHQPKQAWNINIINLNGQPEKGNVKVVIHQLETPKKAFKTRLWERPSKFNYSQEEWHKDLPFDLYADENNFNYWKKEKIVLEQNFEVNESFKFSPENLKKWKEGKYVMEATMTDKFGQIVKDVKYFDVKNSTADKPHIPVMFEANLDKKEAKAGEKIEIIVATSQKNVMALLEVEIENKILRKEWVKISQEQKKFTYTIPTQLKKGNVYVRLTNIIENRLNLWNASVNIPNHDNDLALTFETFRDKLQPGEKETWRIKIKGSKGEKVAAEMLANLYDSSLDAIAGSHNYFFSIAEKYYDATYWQKNYHYAPNSFEIIQNTFNETYYYNSEKLYDYLNMFGLNFGYYYGRRRYMHKRADGDSWVMLMDEAESSMMPAMALKKAEAESPKKDKEEDKEVQVEYTFMFMPDEKNNKGKDKKLKPTNDDLTSVKARTNFNETAFFFPDLKTDAEGNIIVEFTIPESLTKWKMLGFAHTKDLKFGTAEKTLVTQKDLMVVPNAPRFFRENDKIVFQSKITNISDKDLSGSIQLFLSNPLNTKNLDTELGNNNAQQSFNVPKGQSTVVNWALNIPIGTPAVTYKVVAKAGNFSDGEEMTLPVLTNRMLVTETMPLPVRGTQEKKFEMSKLIASNNSSSLKHEKLTVEFTSNPAWYAVQALPYMMEYPYECVEQVFSRLYANSLATHIANSSPKIKQTFEAWKNLTPEAFLSNLDKNQELKNIILEETPWIKNANNDEERKRQIGVLFDLVRMAKEQQSAIEKLEKKQMSSGGFVWFEGMPEDRYMTQYIASGIGHLNKLNIKSVQENANIKKMTKKAVAFLDAQIQKDYDELVYNCKKYKWKLDDQHISYFQVHYLYMRSFYTQPLNKMYQKAFDYYKEQAQKYWLQFNRYSQGMIALALHRLNDKLTPQAVIKSLKEKSLNNEEMGMYWKDSYGFYWYEAPIETHALMIELFSEVAKDEKIVDDLKTWLLKQKQTQDWKTTRATAEACYALLLQGKDWLSKDVTVNIQLGDKKISNAHESGNVTAEAGTGYFKTTFNKEEVKADMGKITVSKNAEGVAWGAVYWQYFEDLDKITPAKTPLAIKKQLFIEKDTDTGKLLTEITPNNVVKVGDLVKVRIEITVDRAMEYVHLKDMRASGFEPIAALSGYRWQDGLGYYESPRDAAMNFFIGYLPKGTFVFEYSLRAMHSGDFSNGITQIQCMYAPEFSSISEGIRVKIEK